MPERTIKVLYYTTMDGETYDQGEKVNLDAAEIERGDELGAFEESESEGPPSNDLIAPPMGGTPTTPGEMSDDDIDALTGEQLDDAVEAAGIDASQGGSLAGGKMSADEKRAALKASR